MGNVAKKLDIASSLFRYRFKFTANDAVSQ